MLTNMYQKVFQLHADLLKALAHPRRLEVINLLQGQELSVTDLQEMLGLPQANLSQHLQILRKHGVVTGRKEGKQVFYKIAHRNFVKACELIRQILIERYDDGPLSKHLHVEVAKLAPIITDPVCGMRMAAKSAAVSYAHDSKRYYFCATGCERKFARTPQRYIPRTEHAYAAR